MLDVLIVSRGAETIGVANGERVEVSMGVRKEANGVELVDTVDIADP